MMHKSINTSIFGALLIVMIAAPSFALAQGSDISYWTFNVGDSVKWDFFDDYYLISDVKNDYTTYSSSIDFATEQCYMEYDVIKEWTNGDLDLSIKSDNEAVHTIRITTRYYPMTSGEVRYVREYYNYTTSNTIRATIPVVIDPEYIPPNGEARFEGPGGIAIVGINITEFLESVIGLDLSVIPDEFAFLLSDDFDFGTIPSALFNLFGDVEVGFYDEDWNTIVSAHYMYSYIAPQDQVEEPYKTYESLGITADVAKKMDMPNDIDSHDDLLLMISANTGVGGIGVDIPLSIDINNFISPITFILGIILDILPLIIEDTGETINMFTDYFDIPPYLGLSLPSGWHIAYSDTSKFIEETFGLGSSFIDKILLPTLFGGFPSLEGFVGDLFSSELSPLFILNVLMLISFSNVLMFPKDFDLETFTEAFDYFDNQMDYIDKELFRFGNLDFGAAWFMLKDMFTVTNTDELTTLTINKDALPTFFDARMAQTNIGMEFSWNKRLHILQSFSVKVDSPMLGAGHEAGMRYAAPSAELSGWQSLLVNISSVFGIIGALIGVGVVIIKKKRPTTRHFKSIAQHVTCDDPETCCDGEFCEY